MVALIVIMLCLIGIYAKKNKQLQQYVHRTATCIELHDDGSKHKGVGCAHKAIVRYEYDGVLMEETLKSTTRKLAPGETVQCLIDPNNPTKVYLYTERNTTRTLLIIYSVVLLCAVIMLLRSWLWSV